MKLTQSPHPLKAALNFRLADRFVASGLFWCVLSSKLSLKLSHRIAMLVTSFKRFIDSVIEPPVAHVDPFCNPLHLLGDEHKKYTPYTLQREHTELTRQRIEVEL